MGFQQALSGLNAATKNLDVIGNNISNASTNGMKVARTEFSELVAASLGSGGGQTVGIGVEVAAVSQQFSQGNLTVTGNDLDIAINGAGFFQLKLPDGSSAYSRAGQFKLDKVGNVITNNGAQLEGYPTDIAGVRTSSTIIPIQLPTAAPIGAKQTANLSTEFNLDARAVVPTITNAGPPQIQTPPLTTYGTSVTAYDSQGVEVPVTLYFNKTGNDTWDVYTDPTTQAAPGVFSMAFLPDGTLDLANTTGNTAAQTLTLTSPNPNIGSFNVTLDVSKATQYGTNFVVTDLTQDGYPPGELVGIKVGEDGIIKARYSNGQTQAAGQLALANFRNVQGLTPIGAGSWIETASSGQPLVGAPGEGKLGKLRAGSLEDSNVDLTAELVAMITAQRAYQANSQTIKTNDQTLQSIINIR